MKGSSEKPFALSLSKGFPSSGGSGEGEGFDKLSPNGAGVTTLFPAVTA